MDVDMVIVKKSLSEQIYELIKQDILNGNLAYGEKIINRELQEKYGVSSTPIRDAVNRLYQDGLIENITKVGARVISFDVNSALEINEIVSLLCAAAVKLSAQSSDIRAVSAQLEKVVDLQKTHVQDDRFFDYDYKFHKTFFDFCNNSRLKALYKQYNMLTRLWTTFFHDQVAYREESVAQHQEIFKTYRAGDVLEAQGLMEYHFAHAGELLKTQESRQRKL